MNGTQSTLPIKMDPTVVFIFIFNGSALSTGVEFPSRNGWKWAVKFPPLYFEVK